MPAAYAKELPSGTSNHVTNIAIVGTSGRIGGAICEALLKAGKHKITAITRESSSAQIPAGVAAVKRINYDEPASIVTALQGQDVLIITMGVMAPRDTQKKLIDGAVAAGVRYVMPSEWGSDPVVTPDYSRETTFYDSIMGTRKYIEEVGAGKSHWVSLSNGFWYEFSLGGTEVRYGFDFAKKTVTIYDDGTTKINTSTWPLCGLAVAKTLSLKILPDDEHDKSPTLSQFHERAVRISSFYISQNDMFDSVLRVTGDKKSDWTITNEGSHARYERGTGMMKDGSNPYLGFGLMLYARGFYPEGGCSFNDKLDNELLGLPKEDLDAATAIGIDRGLKGLN